jgi:hypothetical protein
MNTLARLCTMVGIGAVAGLVGCTSATGEGNEATESAVTGLPSGVREKAAAEQRARDLGIWGVVQTTILDAYRETPPSSVGLWNPEIEGVYFMDLYSTYDPRLRVSLNHFGYGSTVVIRESDVANGKGTMRFFATTASRNVHVSPTGAGVREKLIMTCTGVGLDQGPTKHQCTTHAF